ncbi:MAG: pantoate--beta-alanine ligase [Nitrospira bacterium SG8_35_4]|nr:MAG: pantoate--beta-alanine ligase [Nitrospira bacterium SG8_35_4]
MQLVKTIKEMQAWSRGEKAESKSIGFVPTMGALHDGHLSLVRQSNDENDRTVVSIYVNPAQFGPHEDLDRYPRNVEADLAKLSPYEVDAVFLPDNKEMYPEGFSLSIDVGRQGALLCGASRPGHFNGVAVVVAKLFNIVAPHRAYFGQKDFQQTVIIKKLVRELNYDTDIIVCPIVREGDGLAMSSRNVYLNGKERKAALVLYESLKLGQELIDSGSMTEASSVQNEMSRLIASEPRAALEYVTIVDIRTLEEVTTIKLPLAICIAATIGHTRLIDNLIVER